MEIRLTLSRNVIPAATITGVFILYLSDLVCKFYCNYFIIFFSTTVNFKVCGKSTCLLFTRVS